MILKKFVIQIALETEVQDLTQAVAHANAIVALDALDDNTKLIQFSVYPKQEGEKNK